MTNSEIEPFPSYSPSQRTNIYKIILINYRWDGIRKGAFFLSSKKQLDAGEGSGLGLP